MTTTNGRQIDNDLEQIEQILAPYKEAHKYAEIDARRQNSVSLRVRVIDPDFDGTDRVDREAPFWILLKTLPEDVFTNITMLLLLTPKEAESSLANLEFDDPIPSRL